MSSEPRSPAERDEILESFFREYARASKDSDPGALASHYAGDFLASGPGGGAVFKKR